MNRPIVWRSAVSGLLLVCGIVVPFVVSLALAALNVVTDEDAGRVVALAVFATGLLVAGGLWGIAISRATNAGNLQGMVLAGGVCFAATTLAAFLVLAALEEDLVANGRSPLPIHNLFTLLFVPATFLVAAITGGAVGLVAAGRRHAPGLALRTGAAAALAFLALNVAQDVLGRRVGGPNAAATATMITVTLVCDIGAAMAGSAALGVRLAAVRHPQRANAPSPIAALGRAELDLQHGD